ncbi:hypothetical protein IAT38_007078 [Cryptococcus sp. DSM 104549]
MTLSLTWVSQQLIPPLLLSYFSAAWKICTLEVGPKLIADGHVYWGRIYTCFPTLLITPITILYLRLYFLPRSQSVAPFDPPAAIQSRSVIFECLSPSEARVTRLADGDDNADAGNTAGDNGPLVNRCYKGRCGGRWKPARARHCSQCGVCRGGFDHHCPFFANCLTAPYIPTFLALLVYTPPTAVLLSLPIYLPLLRRARTAWSLARSSDTIRAYWWDWTPSWIVAGGPVGRYAGGLVLGWRELDRVDGGGVDRFGVGLLVMFGVVLALITAGLAYSTIFVLIKGHLTIDRGRHDAHSRALAAISRLSQSGTAIPQSLQDQLSRFSDSRWFYVPVTDDTSASQGAVVQTLNEERAYDHGKKRNWEIVMGQGWRWVLPWVAVRRGMGDEVWNWPLSGEVERRLEEEARERLVMRQSGDDEDAGE